ncbi:MAG: hypothetical protein UX28_C0003G0147 [Candidatus Pacebacteria bacterium GW2011_GWA1_46_10]|nr:MAG: hypothetical protein UX28_C0003G0147 [Candidatus Pacebacteria bacterium GW2011_GWA1_46_10]HCR81592.1 hypothetical protein [Candidatus Paceibacterota bacterium]
MSEQTYKSLPKEDDAPEPAADNVPNQEIGDVRAENEPIATTVLEYVKDKVHDRMVRFYLRTSFADRVMQLANEGQSVEQIAKYWADTELAYSERPEQGKFYYEGVILGETFGEVFKWKKGTGTSTPPEAVINQVSKAVKVAREGGKLEIRRKFLDSEELEELNFARVDLGDGSRVRVDGSFSPEGEVVLERISVDIPMEEALKAVEPAIQAFIEEKRQPQPEKTAA